MIRPGRDCVDGIQTGKLLHTEREKMAVGLLFDTEATGLTEPQIIEWALGLVDSGWHCGLISSGRCCPSKDIEFGAIAQHHILFDELEGKPLSESFRFPDGTTHLIGWNIDFDWEAAGSPEGIKRIDLEKIARRIWPGLDSYSQTAVFYAVFGQCDETRRKLLAPDGKRAEQDVKNLAALLEVAASTAPTHFENLDTLWAFSEDCRIPDVMPFGKHKGDHIRDVPTGYRKWYESQADVDPWILKAFAKYPRH